MSNATGRVVFVDTETTGLDPDVHPIWNVGLIDADGEEHEWFLPVDLSTADPVALQINRFYERHPSVLAGDPVGSRDAWGVTPPGQFARVFAKLTKGCHLAGAVVSFDEERLRRLLRANGERPMWHYHLIDVEALAVGYLYGLKRSHEHEVLPPDAYDDPAVQAAIVGSSYRSLPWRSDDLSSALGVMVSDEDRHTALGDARWARRIYQAVTDPTV